MKKLLLFLIIFVCIFTKDASAQLVDDLKVPQVINSLFSSEQNTSSSQSISPTPSKVNYEENDDKRDNEEREREGEGKKEREADEEDTNTSGRIDEKKEDNRITESITPSPPISTSDAILNPIVLSSTDSNSTDNNILNVPPIIENPNNVQNYYHANFLSKEQTILLLVLSITLFNIGLVLLFAENIVYGLFNLKQFLFNILTSSKFSHKLQVLRSIFF